MAWAISDDGSVIVGHSLRVGGGHAAIRWDDVAPTILPDLPGTQSNLASDVSGDGMVVVGYCGPVPAAQACRWADGQVFGLGDLPGGSLVSSAGGVSFDGSIIVGVGSSANGIEAFRWENGVMVGLGDLPGGSFSSSAYDVAADGSVIVGRGRADSGDEAFIWDEAHGMRNLRSVLVDLDLDMSGWSLTRAHGISADGLTIVGEGVNPSGMGEGWIAHVPEPTSFLLLGLGLMTLWPRRSA
jgi:probable HAF family extracellular repeat protein